MRVVVVAHTLEAVVVVTVVACPPLGTAVVSDCSANMGVFDSPAVVAGGVVVADSRSVAALLEVADNLGNWTLECSPFK